MVEQRSSTVFWRSSPVYNFREIIAHGVVGTGPLLKSVRDCSYVQATKEKVERVLTHGWTEVTDLLREGGFMNGSGRVLESGLENQLLHPRLVEQISDEDFLSYRARDIRDRFGLDLKRIGLNPSEMLYLLNSGSASQLGYYEGSLSPFLKTSDGSVEDLAGMEKALIRYFARLYRQHEVRPLVPPRTATRQVLYQIADDLGLGRRDYREVNPR